MAKKTTIAQPIEKKMRSQSKKTEAAALMPDEQQKKVSASAAKSTKKAKPKTIGTDTDKEKPRKSAAKKQPLAEKMTARDPSPGKARLVNPTVEPAKKAAASAKQKGEKKIFVLDTSVILYNHNSINSFENNDIAIPITVLEELDQFKKGNDTINFEAREFIRIMDRLSDNTSLSNWIPLDNGNKGSFKVVMNDHGSATIDAEKVFGERKGDHRILNAALQLKQQHPDRRVVMVTKDVNLRIKAKALNLPAEDFMTGKIENVDSLYSGISRYESVDPRGISRLYSEGLCEYTDLAIELPAPNQYLILQSNGASALGWYNPRNQLVERLDKHQISKITPRNAEQVFALHAVTNPNIKLVTLQGVAGTGKTLVALAGAWNQRRNYKQIYLARPIVPLSNKDIGFLPGDFKSKIDPYMQPLYDNLKFIQNQYGEHDKEFQNITGALESEKLVIQALAYIRGRSISNVFFIVDEAQNLTPHEVKTIITRAGEGTKIVFTGDIYQIDTPYLDAQSNGLSYLIDRIKQHDLHAHVRLEKGERSDLANLANELL
ncbi:MAG: PhoH family protein [Bacteroidales bacterium]|jgi:PhoH-like ATPase|nr:PhoH family protein [Bacteroidales bacterium]MDD4176690.1 PhoH family protein [Bacteroidales bacterium]MDD4741736.1 PhoH family protein [Bacteroidales bacterium]MDY0334225.1 PhoH family protein [Bacteroidales bacterium]